MTQEIDTLFERLQIINSTDPADLTPTDIDDLVLFYRHRRTRKATFIQSHDSSALDNIMPKPKTEIVPGAVRRFIRVPRPES